LENDIFLKLKSRNIPVDRKIISGGCILRPTTGSVRISWKLMEMMYIRIRIDQFFRKVLGVVFNIRDKCKIN